MHSAILLFLIGTSFVVVSGEGENIALKKPVYAHGKWHASLTDGNLHTSARAYDNLFPYLVVDLLDVYRITKIHLHAQQEPTLNNLGLNISFSLYGWDKPTCRCDFERDYPWKLIKGGLIFHRKGQEIIVDTPVEAQYIILLPDIKDPFEVQRGLTVSEVRAFGKKIRDGLRGDMPPDDEPYPNNQWPTREKLLKGQEKIFGQFSYLQCELDETFDDVALAWQYDRIGLMTAVRGKARTIFMAGEETLRRLRTREDYKALRQNLGAWLTQNDGTSFKYVNVSQPYKDGDILVITRWDKFDLVKVFGDLKAGKNSALLVYMRNRDDPPNKLSELMEKLQYNCKNVENLFRDRELYTKDFVRSPVYVPNDYELRASLHSWKQFRTTNMRYFFPERELQTERIQSLIRQILEKYSNFFTYRGICRINVYHKDPKTHPAFLNYNKLLHLQRGDRIIQAPGLWNTPGGVHPSLKPTNYTVEYKVKIEGRYYPMGGYAKAGEAFYYKVLEHSYQPIIGYKIRVNLMMDEIANLPSVARWFYVTSSTDIPNTNWNKIVSPFGGPIFLWIPGNTTLKIAFQNVYRYPWYDARNKESVADWENQRTKYRGTPYGVVMGDRMLSSMPMQAILRMTSEAIGFSTTYYDNLIKFMHNYRGTDYKKAYIEAFSADDQLAGGYGHSGYPFVGYRDWADSYANVNKIKRGQNIIFEHELGHNHQVGGATFIDGTEVANLIYLPAAHYYLLGIKAYDRGKDPGCTAGEEKHMVNQWKLRKYNVKLSYYNYVGRLFGPDILPNIFPDAQSPKESYHGESGKVSYWIRLLCKESGYDLVPFHRLWSFPMDNKAIKECGKYPCFFPDDDLTKQAQGVVDEILKQYGKQCQRSNPKQVKLNRDILKGLNTTEPQEIFFSFK